MRFPAIVLLGLGLCASPYAQDALCSSVEEVLLLTPASGFERFGSALDYDGTRLVVGRGDGGPVTVLVHAPTGSGFVIEAVLAPPEPQAGAGFGEAVALSGTTLVIGAPAYDGAGLDSGRAYVFEFASNWSFTQTLESDDLEPGDLFGFSCAMESGLLVVGAPGEDDAAFSAGAAYSFVCCSPDWTQDQKLTAPDASFLGRFGASVDLESDTLIVGADLDASDGFAAGAAYMFGRMTDAWLDEGRLPGIAPALFAQAGRSVAVHGEFALVGVPGRDGSRGGADLYERSNGVWAPASAFASVLGLPGARLGEAVSLSATHAALGAPSDGASTPGSVLILGNAGSAWEVRGELSSSQIVGTASFGAAVHLSGNQLAVGAPTVNGPGAGSPTAAGAVSVERLGNEAVAFATGTAGAGGFVPSLLVSGCVGVETPLAFEVSAGAGSTMGFLLIGGSEINVRLLGLDLFVGGRLWLIEPHVLAGTLPGEGSVVLGFEWPVPPTTINLVAQALYADAAAPQGWSATQGVRIQLP